MTKLEPLGGKGETMTKPKWTPGPWHLLSGEGDSYHLSTSTGPNWCGDDTYIGKVIACKADARLIAAAPTLYAALDELVEAVGPNWWGDEPESFQAGALARAKIALKAARGDS